MTRDDRIVTAPLTHEEVQRIITGLEDRLDAARAEADRLKDRLTKDCIIELAVDNQSVSDYITHWEGRALKAEADLDALREQHAAAVEAACREGYQRGQIDAHSDVLGDTAFNVDAAWLASEARKGVARDRAV